jgi:hypothetical protein
MKYFTFLKAPLYVSNGFWTAGNLKSNVVASLVKTPIPCNSLVRLKNLNVSFLSLRFSIAPINSIFIPLCSKIFGAPKLTVTFPLTSSLSYKVVSLVISPF